MQSNSKPCNKQESLTKQKLRVRSVLQGVHHIRFVRQVLSSLISSLVSRGATLPISVSLAPMDHMRPPSSTAFEATKMTLAFCSVVQLKNLAGPTPEVAQQAPSHVDLHATAGSQRQGCEVCTPTPKRPRALQTVRQQALLTVSSSGPQKALGNVESWKRKSADAAIKSQSRRHLCDSFSPECAILGETKAVIMSTACEAQGCYRYDPDLGSPLRRR